MTEDMFWFSLWSGCEARNRKSFEVFGIRGIFAHIYCSFIHAITRLLESWAVMMRVLFRIYRHYQRVMFCKIFLAGISSCLLMTNIKWNIPTENKYWENIDQYPCQCQWEMECMLMCDTSTNAISEQGNVIEIVLANGECQWYSNKIQWLMT